MAENVKIKVYDKKFFESQNQVNEFDIFITFFHRKKLEKTW